MPQLKKIIEPFGAIDVYPAGNGQLRVNATFLTGAHREGEKTGKILDPTGQTIKDYSFAGLPLQLDFLVPSGTSHFTLEMDGNRVDQPLSDDGFVSPSESLTTAQPRVREMPPPAIPKVNPPSGPIMLRRTTEKRKRMAELNEMESPRTIPLWELNLDEESKKEEWTDFDLRVSDKDEGTDAETRDKKTK